MKLHLGDSREILASMEPNSVDAICCDPPYEISFLGRKWDGTGIAYDPDFWGLCLRVLKPGGHLTSFGACRTYHRIAVGIEDAGFEVRDCLQWIFGTGFPKSLNISKAIDGSDARHKQHERRLRFTKYMREAGILTATINELTGTQMGSHYTSAASQPAIMTREHFEAVRHLLTPQSLPVPTWIEQAIDQRTVESDNMKAREVLGVERGVMSGWSMDGSTKFVDRDITAPATPEAQQWDGWGTALKPAYEPIILARKPLAGTVAANVLEYGTGGVNVDGCRVAGGDDYHKLNVTQGGDHFSVGSEAKTRGTKFKPSSGRWPPNILIDQAAAEALGHKAKFFPQFIYEAKASRKEREAGCDGLTGKTGAEAVNRKDGSAGKDNPRAGSGRTAKQVKNYHPTVKPISVIRWILKLITPPGGVVLDPFMGSGTTGCAAALEGFDFIGVEQDPQYMEIAKARIKHWGTDEG